MAAISRTPVPPDSLLRTYRGGARPERWEGSGDCFAVTVAGRVSLREFVLAFYTTRVFRVERLILRLVAGAKSTDAEARAVAAGSGTRFAIWRVGERSTTQLLMCDRYDKTRSWFRVRPMEKDTTLLEFGSAVAASRDRRTGALRMSRAFRWLAGFHGVYSRVLLAAARRRVLRGRMAERR